MSDRNSATFRLGHDIVGPVLHRWLIGLDQYVSYLADGSTRFLFCARAGVRIRYLHERYRAARALPPRTDTALFWVSRLSVCKGVFARAPEAALRVIRRELEGCPVEEAVGCLVRQQPDLLDRLARQGPSGSATAELGRWLASGSEAAAATVEYLRQCGRDVDAYLAGLIGGSERVVLIDSGWKGTVQSLLGQSYPDRDWRGLYVGTMLAPGEDPPLAEKAIGILFERAAHDPAVPASALCECRHLIETVLEPNGPSIEEIPDGILGEIAERAIAGNLADRADPAADALFIAACAYLDEHAGIGLAEAFARYEAAIGTLERILLAPTREEALALVCKDRGADFGRSFALPVLNMPGEGTAEDRLKRALWRQGQMAIEDDTPPTRLLHSTVAGQAPRGAASAAVAPREDPEAALLPEETSATVAIITRTRDRPLLLARAAASVAAQTYRNYQWIVVNDGGEERAVRDVIERCAVDPRRITLLSNPASIGMEAASNLGIARSASRHVVIHDDDDSWSPTFLSTTASFLESPAGARYGGVISRTTYVSEQIEGSSVVEFDRRPFLDWVDGIHMGDMACDNLFPPIAFLYRRVCWERIGGYDESLPVLGDWFFNLEFVLEDDIAVVDEPLAFYHHRDRSDAAAGHYSNSIVGGAARHREFAAVVRNRFIRKYAGVPLAGGIITGMIARRGELRRGGGLAEQETSGSFADIADRRWIVHFVNHYLAAQIAEPDRAIEVSDLLPPTTEWGEACAAMLRHGVAPPAPPDFDEAKYLALNPDVHAAVLAEGFQSGYQHYVLHGRAEGRTRPLPENPTR